MESDEIPDFDRAEETFCDLLRSEGLALPDEVRRYSDPAEIVFVWNDLKRMVVLELEEREPSIAMEPFDSCVPAVPMQPPV